MGAGASREKLRKAVHTLTETDLTEDQANPVASTAFWDELWRISTSAEEIFELIQPDDVRKLRSERKENLRFLLTQAVAQLCQVVETPIPAHFDQALNCVRVLTRVLPFLLEHTDNEEDAAFVDQLLWVRKPPATRRSVASSRVDVGGDGGGGESVGQTEGDGGTTTSTHTGATTASAGAAAGSGSVGGDGGGMVGEGGEGGVALQEEPAAGDPLAMLLVHAAMHMLFLPQFTVDVEEDDEDDDDEDDASQAQDGHARPNGGPIAAWEPHPSVIWASGLGVGDGLAISSTTSYDKNRLEVLRLLLTALCEPLYQRAEGYGTYRSKIHEVITSADCPHAAHLFFSLLNTVLGFDPVGWGLPMGSIWTGSVRQTYLDAAVQVLLVLLDYGPHEGETEPQEQGEDEQEPQPPPATSSRNFIRSLLASIDRPDELSFLYHGMARLLNNVHESVSTLIPGSVLQIQFHQEVLILFWKLLEENPAFMPHILKSCDITQVVVPLCYLIFEARKDLSKVGLVHICTFTLLKLSGERNFGVALNKPFEQKLPADLPLFTGNHADLVVVTLHKVVVNGTDRLSSLYHCFLTIVCNISPYCKSLSLVASVKLLNLFELFTSPRFFYAAEMNHTYVSLLLETFNNVVQYQYDGNPHLIYAIVRRKDAFVKLANLTLPVAIKAARERSDSGTGNIPSQPTPVINTTPGSSHSTTTTNTSTHTTHTPASSSDTTTTGEALEAAVVGSIDGSGGDSGVGGMVGGGGRELSGNSTSTSTSGTDPSHAGADDTDNASLPPPPTASQGKPRLTPGRFIPTQEWLESVKSELPLNTLMRLLQYLVPQLEQLCERSQQQGTPLDDRGVVAFLRSTTLVGLLPVPHPIVIRKYQANHFTGLWFTAYLWGVIFLRNQQLPLFDGDSIRLFTVTVT